MIPSTQVGDKHVAAIAFSSLCCSSMQDFWPLQLTRAYLDESSIARAVEKDLTFHLIPCLLGVREYVVEFVERGLGVVGHFYARRVEVRSHEPANGTFCITCVTGWRRA